MGFSHQLSALDKTTLAPYISPYEPTPNLEKALEWYRQGEKKEEEDNAGEGRAPE